MATRGMYSFYDNVERYENEKPSASVYRHWDNYLEEGGVDLKDFLVEVKKTVSDNRLDDATFLASKYVVYLAREFATDWDKNPLDFMSVRVVEPYSDYGQEYHYHVLCDSFENGLPKVLVDGHDFDGENLFELLDNL